MLEVLQTEGYAMEQNIRSTQRNEEEQKVNYYKIHFFYFNGYKSSTDSLKQ